MKLFNRSHPGDHIGVLRGLLDEGLRRWIAKLTDSRVADLESGTELDAEYWNGYTDAMARAIAELRGTTSLHEILVGARRAGYRIAAPNIEARR